MKYVTGPHSKVQETKPYTRGEPGTSKDSSLGYYSTCNRVVKYVNLGYITRLSYAELLYPRIRVPLLQSWFLGVRTAFQLEGVSPPDHKPATRFGSLATKEKLCSEEKIMQAEWTNAIKLM